MTIPFLVLTDGPTVTSGLARIARDVISRLLTTPDLAERLEVVQLSVQPLGRFGWDQWPVYVVDDLPSYGADTIAAVWQDVFGDQEGILFTVWDPVRVIGISQVRGPWTTWGYFPVDSFNLGRGLTGPHGAAVSRYDRVLAYTQWGAEILRSCRQEAVPWLPHGLEDDWQPGITESDHAAALALLKPRPDHWVLGMVATNQPRKDLGVFCQTLQELRRRGHKVHGWLHTDRVIHEAWSLPQLIADCQIQKRITVTTQMTDRQLWSCYATCRVTMLSSLGEGFGYSIVESLASGTPCVHTTFGGGAELVPKSEWRVPVRAQRLMGPYALVRPVLQPEDFANAVERALADVDRDPVLNAHYCAGAVEHLRWKHLWPRWSSWIRQGLEAL